MKNIWADELVIGKNAVIEDTAIIKGLSGPAKRVVIGDNSYIGKDVQIICDHFEIGDYCKLHHHSNIHGQKPCIIGHNAWIGQYTIIDSIGGVTIGNNCGIGAHSQLWSHIKYGDSLEGCNYLGASPLIIGNDVWFVGHCIVSPITAEDKSMALVGSVVTKDMKFNEVYAGSPAKSISDKIGYQFRNVALDEKLEKMKALLEQWDGDKSMIKIVTSKNDIKWDDKITYFIVSERTYTKKLSESEISFMKFLLPEKAKFIPQKIT